MRALFILAVVLALLGKSAALLLPTNAVFRRSSSTFKAAAPVTAPNAARMSNTDTNNTPRSTHDTVANTKSALLRNLPASVAFLSTILLSSNSNKVGGGAANAATFLKEPTADFVAENAKVQKFAAEQAKVRAAWDGLVATFEKSESPADLEASLKALRIFLAKMPNQIPAGVKKMEFVKTCRRKKLIGKSRKSQPNWTTKVEIEYQVLIQQFNKNVNPDNRTEEKIY